MHCQFLTKDQSHAQGLNNPEQPVFRVLYPQSWTSCSGSFPTQPLHLRTRLPGEARSTHQYHWVSNTLGHRWMWLSSQDAKSKPCCMFQWKCSHLICICTDCFFYKPITACDASITNTASGTMDKTESLPKIKTCQSRSKYEGVLKFR